MNLDDLRALLGVVEHGSFQGAAKAMGIHRTRLRRQIETLEAVVGVPLLHRDTQGVSLTVAGEQVVLRAVPLLAEASTLLSEARAADESAIGTLRMIVPVGFSPGARVRALLALQEHNPQLALDMVEAEDPVAMLRAPFELMLHAGPSPARDGWFSRVLMNVPVSLMASPSYLERRGTPRRVEDLADHMLLTWRIETRFAATWPLLAGATVPIVARLISANAMLLSAVAVAGGGIALLPSAESLFAPTHAQLVPVLEDHVGAEVTFRTLSPRSTRSDPRLRALLENIHRMLVARAQA